MKQIQKWLTMVKLFCKWCFIHGFGTEHLEENKKMELFIMEYYISLVFCDIEHKAVREEIT